MNRGEYAICLRNLEIIEYFAHLLKTVGRKQDYVRIDQHFDLKLPKFLLSTHLLENRQLRMDFPDPGALRDFRFRTAPESIGGKKSYKTRIQAKHYRYHAREVEPPARTTVSVKQPRVEPGVQVVHQRGQNPISRSRGGNQVKE